jgi:hypothetical protein
MCYTEDLVSKNLIYTYESSLILSRKDVIIKVS